MVGFSNADSRMLKRLGGGHEPAVKGHTGSHIKHGGKHAAHRQPSLQKRMTRFNVGPTAPPQETSSGMKLYVWNSEKLTIDQYRLTINVANLFQKLM